MKNCLAASRAVFFTLRVSKGRDMHQIARELHLRKKTVEAHRANIKEKLAVSSAREVVRYASQWVSQQR